MTFSLPFTLPGYDDLLPAAIYDVLIEEELLLGLSFEAYRRTSTHLVVAAGAGRVEMRPVSEKDLEALTGLDHAVHTKRDAAE